MKVNINFEHSDTKKQLANFDFEFFLKQNIIEEKYDPNNVKLMYLSFEETTIRLKEKKRLNKTQFSLFSEGQVCKMFTGGFLPALFGLDESRGHTIIDFVAVGENWAYFNIWQTYYKRKITFEKFWNFITRTGGLLAIFLSIIKVIESINGAI